MKNYMELDTPALLVDRTVMNTNIKLMQDKANKAGIKLRPHTKTHRTPQVAMLQVEAGASGITAAKIGEAEVMAEAGILDIFIANEAFGETKFLRLRDVHRRVRVAIGVDNREQVKSLSQIFSQEDKPLDVLIEIETGEERTGVLPGMDAVELAKYINKMPGLRLRGVFSHEGHAYGAMSSDECRKIMKKSQEDTLYAANLIRENGMQVEEVSIGSTPSLLHGEIMEGITEIRPGTYIYMDAAQGSSIGDFSRCAATILATVISKPALNRVVVDAGVKALTAFTRAQGICHTPGYGLVRGFDNLRVYKLYDEHGIIISPEAYDKLKIGDKIEIIPNHICPTCNLYEQVNMIENGKQVETWPILCRGKSQ